MRIGRIAAVAAALLVAGPASSQEFGDAPRERPRERRLPSADEGSSGERRPEEGRRERRDRAEERIRERRDRGDVGEPRRDSGDGIYRRSNNYRRW